MIKIEELTGLYLVKVEAGANNNKFYRMIKNGDIFEVQFGRIGNSGYQTTSYPMSRWESTLKSKIKKGYADQTRLVADETITQKSREYIDIQSIHIKSIVEKLQSMARKAISDNYTISSNKVSQKMVDEAQLLVNELINTRDLENFNITLVELFKTIPRKMGKVADYLASSTESFANIIQREQDLLDVMLGQVIQNIVEEVVDDIAQPTQTILDAMGLVFEEVSQQDIDTIKHNLGSISDKFHQAWKVTNTRTQDKFNGFIDEHNITNKKMLWHGSRNENWWSIINTGLILRPSAVISGKMFGYGIYFSPKAQKSLGYTSLSGSYWAGGSSNSAFMSLYDVAYGIPYDAHSFENRYSNLTYETLQGLCKGANCLHAHAGNMLRNDEIIVYKEEQLTIKYLVELR